MHQNCDLKGQGCSVRGVNVHDERHGSPLVAVVSARSTRVRPATVGDYDDFARLYPELGTPDPVPTASTWADDLVERTCVATVDDTVVGYCYFQVLAQAGYVRHLVADPTRRRLGIGRCLMLHAMERMRNAGASAFELNVSPTNSAAIALYEGLGLRKVFRTEVARMRWSVLDALTPNAEVVARVCEGPEDSTVEATLGVTRGLLAAERVRKGRVILAAFSDGAPVAVAAFAPAFPGAFPFQVRGPNGTLHAMLTAMHAHRDPSLEHVQVVVADNTPLINELVQAGAWRIMEVLNYKGPLSYTEIQ
jgi:ribosomal protein S18 acetylase RimI-like enzyme